MTSAGLSWLFVVKLGLAQGPVVSRAAGALHMAAADPTPPSDVFPLTLVDPWLSDRGLCALSQLSLSNRVGAPEASLHSAWVSLNLAMGELVIMVM